MLIRSKTKKRITGRFLSDSFSFGFFHRLLSLFAGLENRPLYCLCHVVQANLHLSEKAWENNVQFATRKYYASVEGHMQSRISQL